MFLILHNPLSKNKKSKKNTKKILDYLKRHNIPCVIRSSLKIENLNEYLNERPQITKLLIVGGDGSVNYFINHVNFNEIKQEIYLIKNGSGNDFLRTLKPINTSNVDIFKVESNNKTHKFANGCGFGLDALIAHKANQSKHKNKLSYLTSAVSSVIQFKPTKAKLEIDNEKYEFNKCYFVTMQNGKYFGGGMKITPQAKLDDNMLDVVVVHNVSKLFILFVFLTVYLGLHTKFKKFVFYKQGTNIKAEMDCPMYMQTDGEIHNNISSVTVTKEENITFNSFNK